MYRFYNSPQAKEVYCKHSWRGRGWDEFENSMETYTLTYVKQIARRNLLCYTGSSIQCTVTTYRVGQDGIGWEKEGFQKGGRGHVYTCG